MLDRGCGVVLAAVERALEPGIRIVLDLSDVAAIDVAGARAIRDCCELAERAGTELSVQDPSPVVQRVLAGVP